MDDRMLGMLTQIVRALLHEPERRGAEEEIVNLLLQEGYRIEEIVDAFKWLERFSKYMSVTDPEDQSAFFTDAAASYADSAPLEEKKAADSAPVSPFRILHRREAQKFTEEGQILFFNWLQTGLISSEERESILHRLLQEKDHSVGREELMALARKEAQTDSALALFLMETTGGCTGPH